MSKSKSSARFRFCGAAVLLAALVLIVPALQAGDQQLYLLAGAVAGALALSLMLLPRLFGLDRLLFSLALYLCVSGIFALLPGETGTAAAQGFRCLAGLTALLAGATLIRVLSPSLITALISGFLGLMMLSGGLIVPDWPPALAGIALCLLLIAFAVLLSLGSTVPALLLCLAGLGLLLFQGLDLEAVLWSLTFMLVLWACEGNLPTVLMTLLLTGLFFLGASVLREESLFSFSAQTLLPELSAAGLWGQLSDSQIPGSADSSSLFLALTQRYGLFFSGLTALLSLPMTLRSVSIATVARSRFHAALAMGCTLDFALRMLAGLLSHFGVLPISLLPLPLLTIDAMELASRLFALGLLCGISARNEADLAEDAHLAMLAT